MANGLNVVSIDIPAIKQSAVSPTITFYSKQEPDKIAKAVVEAVYNPKSTTEILKRLDKEFGENLRFCLIMKFSSINRRLNTNERIIAKNAVVAMVLRGLGIFVSFAMTLAFI